MFQTTAFEDPVPLPPGAAIVRDGESFERMLRILDASDAFAFDTETSGLAWWAHARACGFAFATRFPEQPVLSFYVPTRHQAVGQQLAIDQVGPAIKRLLEDPRKQKIAHNLKFDEHMILREGWCWRGSRYDTLIAARLYNENHGAALKERAATDLGYADARSSEQELGRAVFQLAKQMRLGVEAYRAQYGYSQVAIPLAGAYACKDAQYTWELFEFYERWGVSRHYARIWQTEMRLTEVLCAMEERGMLVDREYLEMLRGTVGGVKAGLEDQLHHKLGGDYFDVGSDMQLREYLIERMRLPLHRRTKKQQFAVDRETLEEFLPHDSTGLLDLILRWRDAQKIQSTYTTSILERLDAHNVLHGGFNSTGTNTGRLSSSEPNLQNFSSDDDDRAVAATGKKVEDGGVDPWSVRRAFKVWSPQTPRLLFDYSQIELRVLAYYSRDPIMVDVYLKGGDIHKRTAEEVGVNRRTAKVINFGLSYCLTPEGLARQVKMSPADATTFMGKFFDRYKGITAFRGQFWNGVRATGGTFQNRFGRTRRVPEINSPMGWQRRRAERQAIGSLIQGTAAELTKESLVRVYDALLDRKLPAWLTSTVHDEIWVDTAVGEFAQVARMVKQQMEYFPEFAPIPITVSVAYTTTNWAEKKAV